MEKIPNKEQDPKQRTPEEKDILRARLNSIVSQSITTANIDTFADSALNELILFTGEIVEHYKTEHPKDIGSGKELEDRAFSTYGLDDLNLYLVRVQEKSDQIHQLDKALQDMSNIPEVITPPDKNSSFVKSSNSSNPFEEKVLISRLKLLLYILGNDFNLKLEDVQLTRGIVTDTMVRRESYVTAEIPALRRVVQICDEEGNASYVFDGEIMAQEGISVADLNRSEKREKNELIDKFRGIGTRLIQQAHWRDVMAEFLSSPLEKPEEETVDPTSKDLPQVITSEFDPWRGFLEADGMRWGTKNAIIAYLHTNHETIGSFIKKHPEIPSKEVRDLTGKKRESYPIEQIEPKFKELFSLSKVATSGEWKGFYESEDKHWGTAHTIAMRLGLTKGTIEPLVRKHPEIQSKRVRDLTNKEAKAYSLEQIKSNVDEFLSLPKVATSGEWKGFYESEGEHWGPINTIEHFLGVLRGNIYYQIKRHPEIPSKKLRDLTGKEISNAYSLEQIKNIFKIKSRP
ncbi:MAG: hypothetical protein ABSB00_03270 [Minisyncoccia bacterium]|jgi:hypothetical protein